MLCRRTFLKGALVATLSPALPAAAARTLTLDDAISKLDAKGMEDLVQSAIRFETGRWPATWGERKLTFAASDLARKAVLAGRARAEVDGSTVVFDDLVRFFDPGSFEAACFDRLISAPLASSARDELTSLPGYFEGVPFFRQRSATRNQYARLMRNNFTCMAKTPMRGARNRKSLFANSVERSSVQVVALGDVKAASAWRNDQSRLAFL